MDPELKAWLESGEYLPEFMRDFHDQKDLFKDMHSRYAEGAGAEKMPNWIDGHCYTVDWLLWYLAGRGYTLQKTRKKLNFIELPSR